MAHEGLVEVVQVVAANGRAQLEEVVPVASLPNVGRRAVGQFVDRSALNVGTVGLAVKLAGQANAARLSAEGRARVGGGRLRAAMPPRPKGAAL